MADQRIVKYGDREMPLEPGMTLEQAKELMARHFPELADPRIETKKDGDKTTYVFSKKAGHKGRGRRRSTSNVRTIRALRTVRPTPAVDPRLAAYVESGQGERLLAGDLAMYLEREVDRVVAARQALADLPSTLKPHGSIL